MAEKNKAVPASYLLIEKEGKVLLLRRYNTGYQDGNYQPPAGHVDAGELPSEAAIREAKEEVGIDINPEDIALVHTSYRTKHDTTADRADYFFKVHTWKGEIVNAEPEKCDELLWVSLDALPENTVPNIKEILGLIQKGVHYSEFDAFWLKSKGLYDLKG